MAGLPGFRKTGWLSILLGIGGLQAQTCLVLSPATIATNGTASMDLSLYSSSENRPAALQWTFRYSASEIKALVVDDGPVLSPGKTAICAGDAAAYKCLAVGATKTTIANGVVVKVTAIVAPGIHTPTIQITDTFAASAAGYPIPLLPEMNSVGAGLFLRLQAGSGA